MDEPTFRLRVRYCKIGRLRYLSHLEVMRALERAIRRAGLPYAVSQGFSPRMKAAFGPALSVGTAGEDEYLDIWLLAFVPPDEALALLRAASGEDLAPLAARYVSKDEPSLSQALSVSHAHVVLDTPDEDAERYAGRLQEAIAKLVGQGAITVMRKDKPKRIDLAGVLQRLPEAHVVEPRCDADFQAGSTRCAIELWTRSGEQGSLRTDVFLDALEGVLGEPVSVREMCRQGQYAELDGELSSPL